ncbi:hypothetical protein Dsin_014472 [Dipteronia sinensis]|uniref:At1g61320/AtMIF1 LRR domain-containing protein n=1 Tax=Dipteronia sinensis TaxID=43782 RepID=A0AAE0AMA4_9ROSI|nr:hypothetical protein Dsin_014472 [Dipteronia sinensis]
MSIKEFTLEINLFNDPDFVTFVDVCVFYAIKSNVKDLKLNFFSLDRSYNWHDLFGIVLSAKTLHVLKLRGCKLELPRNTVKLLSLKKLNLSHVYIDDHIIENLVVDCPLIEYLKFDSCVGFKRLKLSNLSRLSEMKIKNNHRLEQVDIKALNVLSLTVFECDKWWLHVPLQINIAFCKNLNRLSLSHVSITDEWFGGQISQLPMLNYLFIFDCNELKSIEISSKSKVIVALQLLEACCTQD